jgi:hypothetical protein
VFHLQAAVAGRTVDVGTGLEKDQQLLGVFGSHRSSGGVRLLKRARHGRPYADACNHGG